MSYVQQQFGVWSPLQMNTDWLPASSLIKAAYQPQQPFYTVTATPVPAGLPLGNPGILSTEIAHVTVVAPNGPAMIVFAHGLLHTPSQCWIIKEDSEGTTAAAYVGAVISDFNATNITIAVSIAGTYDVYYV